MSSEDISRFLFQPRKRYSGVRIQQGRVLLDSDWNENERIDSEESRRNLLEIVCGKGSSNQGFRVLPLGAIADYDFSYENGSFFLGGLRFETETPDGSPETFLQQPDWLQIESNLPQLPTLTGSQVRYDLIYLRGWEQCVSAVEDSELLERALGVDTSVRIRRMRQVQVLTDVPGNCTEAFSQLQQVLSAPMAPDTGASHRFDALSGELLSKAQLTVAPDPNGVTDDPCKPAVIGGYLGADNQAIRIGLTATNRFIWGYDNAAPLYRVQVTNIPGVANGERRKLKFLTLPRDQMAHPLAGQAVEIIPWGAILPNQEKVAEFQVSGAGDKHPRGGELFTISTSYDPEDNSLTIAQPVPPTWLDWLSSHSQYWSDRDPSDQQQYLYLRLWTGGSGDANTPEREFTPGTVLPLTGTGLSVTFSDYGLAGDFWVVAARPNTPDLVVPWELLDKAPPVGARVFFAPLALIRWSLDTADRLQASVQDCRETFQPLCQIRGCCTVTVGEGSHGDFHSIQDALNSLPEAGGKICLLPGTYRENVLLERKTNITIAGCGDRSRVISPTEAPVFQIKGSEKIEIESIAIAADTRGIGILIESLLVPTSPREPATAVLSREILLSNLQVEAATRSAIEVHNGQFITIGHCQICMDDVASPWPGIYFVGDDALIEDNVIQVQSAGQQVPVISNRPPRVPPRFVAEVPIPAAAGLGGLQIGGTSERVRVLNNLIQGGIGNGITLGSIAVFDEAGNNTGIFISWVVNADDPCGPCKPGSTHIPPDREGGGGSRQAPAGALYDIAIEQNRIFHMGLNGIGVIGFFSLDAADEFISVRGLTIVGNEIRHCLQRPLEVIPPNMIDSMGYGGIALADTEDLVIRDNVIEDNGPSQIEPVCGIFVLHGEGIEIDRNRILNNGAKQSNQSANEAKDGRRGGINVVFGIAPTVPTRILGQDLLSQNGVPAIKIHNNIVSVPLGQALSLTALGPVTVVGNQFTSRGMILRLRPLPPSFIASTVAILNLGLSNELYGQLLLAFSAISNGQLGQIPVPTISNGTVLIPQRGLDDLRLGLYLGNGNVLFSENQCVLDLLETGFSLSLSSIFIISLDDISFHNNQCDANLLDDFLLSQAILFGVSLRVSDNRLKEGLFNGLFSAVTLGIMNMTTDNQATHCLLIRGSLVVNQPNTILVELFNQEICGSFGNVLSSFGRN